MAYHLNVDSTGLERGTKGTPDFPVSCSKHPGGNINGYDGHRFECHFHPEPELTLFTEGEMYYQVNDRVFLMRAGDAVFANCSVMHAGWQSGEGDCWYRTVNFAPVIISGHDKSLLEQEYVNPYAGSDRFPFLVLRGDSPEDAEAMAAVREIFHIRDTVKEGYPLLIKAAICRFWYHIYLRAVQTEPPQPSYGAATVKQAISFMEAHFTEKLTLDELSRACGLSRSELCRTFRRFTGRTPFSYLQHLRIRRSLPLLQDPAVSITQVATQAGFAGSSYYAEIFRRYMGLSPVAYRRRQAERSSQNRHN